LRPKAYGIERWGDDLVDLGFERAANRRSFRRGPHTVTMEGEWVVVTDEADVSSLDPLRAMHGHPGLWRITSGPGSGYSRRVFEIAPALAHVGRAGASVEEGTFRELVEWALATSGGPVPGGWTIPQEGSIDAWIPPADLTLRADAHLVQGSVIADEDRVAIRFPLPTVLDGALSPSRSAWLEALLREAQESWRMVRIEVDAEGVAAAAIDLTGAPHGALECLSRTAVDTLRWVVEWLVPTAAFIADPSRGSRALEARFP
jgi:hypothetical protein